MSQLPPPNPPTPALIQQYYTQHLTEVIEPQVSNLERISDGWENDVYVYRLESGPTNHRDQQEYVLRVYPGNDSYEKSAREFRTLDRLKKADYPVPYVYQLERDQSPFNRPFVIMEKITGVSMWPLMFSNHDASAARKVNALFCELFVQLHRLDWQRVIHPDELRSPDLFDDLLPPQFQYVYRMLEEEGLTGLMRVFDWLQAHKAAIRTPALSLIHWDFHPKNIIVREAPVQSSPPAYVIDWTTLEMADFRYDLAWTLTLMQAYQGPEARSSILCGYEQASGQPVENLAFFEVAAGLRRLFSILYSLKKGAEHLGMRPGAENIMRGQRVPLERVYTHMHALCGVDIPELEEFFKA